jgi:hypothetical protein
MRPETDYWRRRQTRFADHDWNRTPGRGLAIGAGLGLGILLLGILLSWSLL